MKLLGSPEFIGDLFGKLASLSRSPVGDRNDIGNGILFAKKLFLGDIGQNFLVFCNENAAIF